MKKISLFVLLCLILLIILPSTSKSQALEIKSIKAFLIYNQNKSYGDNKVAGTLSENIIDNPDFILWNTIIGEGDALGSSDQTLVMIEVGCTSEALPVNPVTLRFKVLTDDGREIYSSEITISIFEKSSYHTSFLLNDTGCTPLKLTAELINSKSKKVESLMKKDINFSCGE